MVVVLTMVERFVPINQALDGAKVLHVARNGYGAFLIEAILLFSFFEQLHEQWVVHVHHRDHKPLLLLSLPYQDRQTPFWNVLQILLLLMLVVVVKVKVRNVQMKTHEMMVVVVMLLIMMIAKDPHNVAKKLS